MDFEYLIWFLLILALISTIIFVFCSLKLAASCDNQYSKKIISRTTAEAYLLYLALTDKEKCKLICDQNNPEDFMYKPYQELFRLIQGQNILGLDVDLSTVVSKVSEDKDLSAILTFEDLISICDCDVEYRQVKKYLDDFHLKIQQ